MGRGKWKKKGVPVTQGQNQPVIPAPGNAGVGQPVAAAPRPPVLEFLWKTHSYTNEYIRFADPKAGILIALAGGLIAALYAAKCHQYCSPTRLDWKEMSWLATFLGACSLVAFVFLGLSVLFNGWAVAPRLWRTFVLGVWQRLWKSLNAQTPPPGYVFWGDVLLHQDGDTYWKAARKLTEDEMGQAVAKHVYTLAGIANEKFKWVTRGTMLGYAGAVFACIVLVLVA
jgi:hypothetical protein